MSSQTFPVVMSIPPIASMNWGKAARLTTITWLTLMPVNRATVRTASPAPPYAYAALILLVP